MLGELVQVEFETLGYDRRGRCFTRRQMFLKQFMLFIFILTIVLLLSFSAGDEYPSKVSDQLLRMDLECVLLPSV